jgi:hypothetical protein
MNLSEIKKSKDFHESKLSKKLAPKKNVKNFFGASLNFPKQFCCCDMTVRKNYKSRTSPKMSLTAGRPDPEQLLLFLVVGLMLFRTQ